jgi:serine O-acetyltransferase
MLGKLFKIMRENGRILIVFFGMRIKFKNPLVSQLGDCCCIGDLQKLLDNRTRFPHPIGIVVTKDVVIGKDCAIYQNVTIDAKYFAKDKPPILGDNVRIYANACIIGDIKIGNNAVIAAGAVVLEDVPPNAVVAGNPAKIIGYQQS